MRRRSWDNPRAPSRQVLAAVTNTSTRPMQLSSAAGLKTKQQQPLPLSRAQTELGVLALHRLMLNLCLLGRYLHKWRLARGLRSRNRRLARIFRETVIELIRRSMDKWRRCCYLAMVGRNADCMAITSQTITQSRYFWKFVRYAFKARQRRHACSILATWRKQSTRKLLIEFTAQWRAFAFHARQSRARAVAFHSASLKRRSIQIWRRHLRLKAVMARLSALRRRALRQNARSILVRWSSGAAMRLAAIAVEQRNLTHVATRYYLLWYRARTELPLQRRVDKALMFTRMRQAFSRWHRWLLRIVQAYQIEQQRHVVLLQRYYLRWRVLHDAGFLAHPRRKLLLPT